jgi:hypothetical protein
MKLRKSLVVLAATAATAMAGLVAIPGPATADTTAGVALGLTIVNPDLTDQFPCQGGGGLALDSFSNFLGIGGQSTYTCHGALYPPGAGAQNSASVVLAGVDATTSTPYSFAGTGNIGGAYTYSEPCQDPDGDGAKDSLSGEAEGVLTSTLTGAGVIGSTPVTDITVAVGFKWSRVGFNAIIGLKGAKITAGSTVIDDPSALGVAAAVFIPSALPNCAIVDHPGPGAINIVSGTLQL